MATEGNHVSDYQLQLKKLRRWNRLVVGVAALFMLLVFFLLTGYAIWAGNRDNAQTASIIDTLTEQTLENRKRGDAILCMLSVPAEHRTQEIIDLCLARYDLDKDKLNTGAKHGN